MRNLDEIIHTVNSIYGKAENAFLRLKDPKHGLIHVNTATEKWYIVIRGNFNNVSEDLHFTAGRGSPFIMMYFQLQCVSTFATDANVRVAGHTHSLNYLLSLKFNTCIKKDTVEEFFCVKIFPELLLQQLQDSDENNPLVDFLQTERPFCDPGVYTSNEPDHLSVHS